MKTLLASALLLLLAVPPGEAQLASPGPLTRAHAQLEGLRSCTRCHELRQEGVSPALCLECHSPLARRLRARRGLHGRLTEKGCADCHQEHIGAGADIVRLDTASFRHDRTGFPLRGAHTGKGCRTCHSPSRVVAADVRAYAPSAAYLSRTFLGLATTCEGCHLRESPHEEAINRLACERCHEEREWARVERFDHDRSAYPLTGAHRAVACEQCHQRSGKLQLQGIAHASCANCHRDPHAGRFGGECAGCHQTASWQRVPAAQVAARFDHARTRFPLRGAHARAACAACHERATARRGGDSATERSRPEAARPDQQAPVRRAGLRIAFRSGSEAATFPPPVFGSCGSCHTDFHQGQVRRAAEACERCHAEEAWLPVQFDAASHGRETRFPLADAHLAVPCGECHVRTPPEAPPQLQWQDLDCLACHASDDPHRGMFGTQPCGACHTGGVFKDVKFDHGTVATRECTSCHRDDSPHGDQFGGRSLPAAAGVPGEPGRGRDCVECHVTTSFRVERFDHARTRFPLDGAHTRAACSACHSREADGMVRYRPLPVTCAGCHGVTP